MLIFKVIIVVIQHIFVTAIHTITAELASTASEATETAMTMLMMMTMVMMMTPTEIHST
jgi:hypothetical protein